MTVWVQKYGGSSVADVEKIRRVAERVKARCVQGHALVVVVSAMGDATDELLALAKRVSPDPPRRELDMLLTCGERVSMALLSMALHEIGIPAVSFTGSQSGIITDEAHARARIVEVRPSRIQEALDAGKVAIVAGYQGVSRSREITTLGRGGSDSTAVALAAALGAEACEIYSDVDGVFSADPRVVPDARRLDTVSYEAMQTLAKAGAQVLNAQAVEFARVQGIEIRALRTDPTGEGTRIQATAAGLRRTVVAVTSERNVGALDCTRAHLPAVLELLETRGGRLRWISETREAVRVVFALQDVHGLAALERELTSRQEYSWARELGTATVVGSGVLDDPSVLRRCLAVCVREGVTHQGLHAAPLELSFLVASEAIPGLVRALHASEVLKSA